MKYACQQSKYSGVYNLGLNESFYSYEAFCTILSSSLSLRLAVMCLTNTSSEVILPVVSANMSDSYTTSCYPVSKTFDANLNDKGCDCALSAVAESPSNSRYYWWRGALANVSRVRALHVWVRKGKCERKQILSPTPEIKKPMRFCSFCWIGLSKICQKMIEKSYLHLHCYRHEKQVRSEGVVPVPVPSDDIWTKHRIHKATLLCSVLKLTSDVPPSKMLYFPKISQ